MKTGSCRSGALVRSTLQAPSPHVGGAEVVPLSLSCGDTQRRQARSWKSPPNLQSVGTELSAQQWHPSTLNIHLTSRLPQSPDESCLLFQVSAIWGPGRVANVEGQLAEQVKVLHPKAWSGRVPAGAVWGWALLSGVTFTMWLSPPQKHISLTMTSPSCYLTADPGSATGADPQPT